MRYMCVNCSYIYDESIGDSYEDIKSGTKFFDLGNNFKCPVCGEEHESFQEIIEEVNYINNDKIFGIDLEHYIEIEKKDNDNILVSIGKNEFHPSGEEHRITQISLLDEYGDLVEDKFFLPGEDPVVEFDISTIDDYEIQTRCSIHGLWGIKVEN